VKTVLLHGSAWFAMERPKRFGHLCRPRLSFPLVADPGFRVVLNRYPFSVIGVQVVVWDRRSVSLVWGRPIRYGEVGQEDASRAWRETS
jgi:hypothetical protein